MSEDIYAKPDLSKKVRFQTGEKEDRNTDVGDTIDNVTIYDNYLPEGSTPPTSQDNTSDDQQQTTSVNVSSGKRKPLRAAAVFLGLLCLVLLVAVIVLVVLLIQDIQDKNNLNMERNRLWVDNANLTSELDKLQTSYSEMESNLTRKTSQLEEERNFLKAINNNLTHERDELQKQIETTCCTADWTKFGNSCYLISTSKKDWTDSRRFCENLGAQLVIISSAEEQEFISSLDLRTWIGLTDEEKEGDWRWVNGLPATTTYFRHDQPDNNGPNGQSENCVEIYSPYSTLNNWNDMTCSFLSDCICEKVLQ